MSLVGVHRRSALLIPEHMEEDDAATKALPEWVRLEWVSLLRLATQ
jgi:hypothetical protein